MTTVVNLNKHRKAKTASQAKVQAVENRVQFGRTKVEKAFDAARTQSPTRLDAVRSPQPEQD